jgi:hypothetical protein
MERVLSVAMAGEAGTQSYKVHPSNNITKTYKLKFYISQKRPLKQVDGVHF